jgi:hypothetical protein
MEPSSVNGHETTSPRNHHGSDQPLATTTAVAAAAATTTTATPAGDITIFDRAAASSNTLDDAPPHLIPPYFNASWLERTNSSTTTTTTITPGLGNIDLVDQSNEDHESGRACWASSVSVDDFVVVSGPTGLGAYVVWHCNIETFKGGTITLRKRFVKSVLPLCTRLTDEFKILRVRHSSIEPCKGVSIIRGIHP